MQIFLHIFYSKTRKIIWRKGQDLVKDLCQNLFKSKEKPPYKHL